MHIKNNKPQHTSIIRIRSENITILIKRVRFIIEFNFFTRRCENNNVKNTEFMGVVDSYLRYAEEEGKIINKNQTENLIFSFS